MATQRIVVDGVDITPYVASMRCSRNDIDAPGSGRDMNGDMMRSRVAVKAKLEIECRILTDPEAEALAGAIGSETVLVSYLDPYFGRRSSVEFYGSEMHAAVWRTDDDGSTYWNGISFNLIEV